MACYVQQELRHRHHLLSEGCPALCLPEKRRVVIRHVVLDSPALQRGLDAPPERTYEEKRAASAVTHPPLTVGHVPRELVSQDLCPGKSVASYRGNLRLRGSSNEPPEPQGCPRQRPRAHPGRSISWVYPPFGERAHSGTVAEKGWVFKRRSAHVMPIRGRCGDLTRRRNGRMKKKERRVLSHTRRPARTPRLTQTC